MDSDKAITDASVTVSNDCAGEVNDSAESADSPVALGIVELTPEKANASPSGARPANVAEPARVAPAAQSAAAPAAAAQSAASFVAAVPTNRNAILAHATLQRMCGEPVAPRLARKFLYLAAVSGACVKEFEVIRRSENDARVAEFLKKPIALRQDVLIDFSELDFRITASDLELLYYAIVGFDSAEPVKRGDTRQN